MAQVPPGFDCGPFDDPAHFDQQIAGVKCTPPGVNNVYYYLFADPAQANRPFDFWVSTLHLFGGDCLAGEPGSAQVGRFRVFCSLNAASGRPGLGWVDPDNLIYGKVNGARGDSIAALTAWWQRNAVRHEMVELVGATQCEAVDWAASHGLDLSVAAGAGVRKGVVERQDPATGTLLESGGQVSVSVPLDGPSRLLGVTGQREALARNLLQFTGNTRVRTIYLPEDTSAAPGVVIGTVPRVGSLVDSDSCIDLLVAGPAPATVTPTPTPTPAPTLAPTATPPGPSFVVLPLQSLLLVPMQTSPPPTPAATQGSVPASSVVPTPTPEPSP